MIDGESLRLLLVATRCTTTTGAFELASLRADIRSWMWMWNSGSAAEMLASFASIAFSLDEDRVVAGWWHQSQLIECDHLTASLCDSLTSTFSDTESTDAELGNLQQTQVIGDGANDDCNVVLLGLTLLQQSDDALERDNRLVNFAHKQTLQDDLVELLVRATVQEAIQLKQKEC